MTSQSPRDFVSSSSLSSHTLPEGTRLRDFEINGLIGEGGFGIVYLAYDHSLGRRVAIKEYMPASMASRAHASSAVVVKSQRHEETFRLGLKSFVNEARLLARFDHPALVKVYRFWEENGTAYMVMPYYQGPTLKLTLAELGRTPTEAELRGWLGPLLDALAVMHEAHCFHRDIAPDNILLTSAGPLLLDFGAARHVIGDMTHALTVVLKPGFAPIEQYGEVPTLTQGAWTDLYALASVVYAAVTGKAPVSAVERLIDDRHVPLAQLAAAGRIGGPFSDSFVSAVDAALHLRPRDRPQDVAAFRLLLDGQAAPDSGRSPFDFVSTFGTLPEVSPETTVPPPHSDLPRLSGTVPPQPPPRAQPSIAEVAAPGSQPPLSEPSRRRPALAIGAALAGVAALAAGGWYLMRSEGAAETAAPSPAVTAVPAPAPAPAPPPAPAPVPAPVPTPAAAPSVTATTRPPEASPAPAPQTTALPSPALSPATSPATSPVPESTPPAPAATTAPPPPAPAPVAAAKPKREPRSTPAETAARPTPPERATPTNAAATRARCSDILQKASLEPLTPSEAAYLRRECQ